MKLLYIIPFITLIILTQNSAYGSTEACFDGPVIDANCQEEAIVNTDAFITTWQTTASNESITITINPDIGGATVQYDIDWGDGSQTEEDITTSISHTYSSQGKYTVTISGDFPGIAVNQPLGNAIKLLSIKQWGTIEWKTMQGAFSDAELLELEANDAPNLKFTTSTAFMFRNCSTIDASLNHWDVQFIEDMSSMFENTNNFNGKINSWITSSVTNMVGMFKRASNFNQPIGSWNTSNVTDMSSMFSHATQFNQSIGSWNTGNVTSMSFMFGAASSFNRTLNTWNTENVINMNAMFQGAEKFNQLISSWNTINVTNMRFMFSGASSFDQDIGNWNTGKVEDMSFMFQDASSFNQKIGGWNTGKVVDMSAMFSRAYQFNQPIGNWNTGSVIDMQGMFTLAFMFNQPIGNWDTGSLTSMEFMFSSANSFNQYIGDWNLKKVINMNEALNNSNLSVANYDATLIGWANQNISNSISLGASGLAYCAGESARQFLIDDIGWIIEGDHLNCMGTSSCPTTQFNTQYQTGSWHDSNMWSLDQIPTTCDKVRIRGFYSSTIENNAECFSLEVVSHGTLEVSVGSTLEVWLGDH